MMEVQNDIKKKKIRIDEYNHQVNLCYKKSFVFCRTLKISIHLQTVAIKILDIIFHDEHIEAEFNNWYFLFIVCLWIACKFYEDDPYSITFFLRPEYGLTDVDYLRIFKTKELIKHACDMEIQVLKLLKFLEKILPKLFPINHN